MALAGVEDRGDVLLDRRAGAGRRCRRRRARRRCRRRATRRARPRRLGGRLPGSEVEQLRADVGVQAASSSASEPASRSIAARARRRLKPNFEFAWPVEMWSWVSPRTSGVTRSSTRWRRPSARRSSLSMSSGCRARSATAGVERHRELGLAAGVAVQRPCARARIRRGAPGGARRRKATSQLRPSRKARRARRCRGLPSRRRRRGRPGVAEGARGRDRPRRRRRRGAELGARRRSRDRDVRARAERITCDSAQQHLGDYRSAPHHRRLFRAADRSRRELSARSTRRALPLPAAPRRRRGRAARTGSDAEARVARQGQLGRRRPRSHQRPSCGEQREHGGRRGGLGGEHVTGSPRGGARGPARTRAHARARASSATRYAGVPSSPRELDRVAPADSRRGRAR